jgi:hypothetical protein
LELDEVVTEKDDAGKDEIVYKVTSDFIKEKKKRLVTGIVLDQDPKGFRPPVSGSVIICKDPSINKQKKI